ncbi:Uncharacterized protein HZ326_24152 [Fusarium oxysporum f. sp. albedinis]|nr:Uncharacterized protein HZ326_24152 [Fusarium oxysporum f. sp. albedinis]
MQGRLRPPSKCLAVPTVPEASWSSRRLHRLCAAGASVFLLLCFRRGAIVKMQPGTSGLGCPTVMLLDWRQFGLDWIYRKIAGLDLGFSKIWTGLD